MINMFWGMRMMNIGWWQTVFYKQNEGKNEYKLIYLKTKKKKIKKNLAWFLYSPPENWSVVFMSWRYSWRRAWVKWYHNFMQLGPCSPKSRRIFIGQYYIYCVSVLYSSKVELLMVSQGRHFGNCWNPECIKTD